MKVVLEPSDSSRGTKMEPREKKQYKNSTGSKMEPVETPPPTYAENEGGGDKKSKQYKESKITGAKKEPVINPHTYSEGPKGQLIDRGIIGGTKTEPPINKGKSETPPPTYYENYA